MSEFITKLTDELRDVTGVTYLSQGAVKRAIQVAAGRAVRMAGGPTLRRVVSPGSGRVYHVLETSETDMSVLLTRDDVTTLRAILATYDETIPARPGDALTEPMRLENGLVVTTWPDGETLEV